MRVRPPGVPGRVAPSGCKQDRTAALGARTAMWHLSAGSARRRRRRPARPCWCRSS
jgi:hypothetical protein